MSLLSYMRKFYAPNLQDLQEKSLDRAEKELYFAKEHLEYLQFLVPMLEAKVKRLTPEQQKWPRDSDASNLA